jgi:hypothetical protein
VKGEIMFKTVTIFTLLLLSAAWAGTVVFQPDDTLANDSYINSSYPSGNWGDNDYMYVGYNNGGIFRSFIQFVELASYIGGDYDVTSATLTLFCLRQAETPVVNVDPCESAFAEGSLTWSNQPDIVSGYTATFTFPEGEAYAYADVTDTVADWVTGDLPHYGFSLRLQSEYVSSLGALSSGEYEFEPRRPKLTMEYTGGAAVEPDSLGRIKAGYR